MNAPVNPARLYLVRHGETDWSLTGQHTSRTDILLTEQGDRDAHTLKDRLRSVTFSRVFTSPRQRAQRTCALAGLTPVAEIEPDLVEWDYGDYEGRRSVDICMARPNWNLFRDGCPRGETPAQVSARADRLIASLRGMRGNIALFSHGQFGCVLAARWIGLPLIEGPHFLLDTASISILGYEPHHPEVAVIALWNASSREMTDSGITPSEGDSRITKHLAMERQENESGEIPHPQRRQSSTSVVEKSHQSR